MAPYIIALPEKKLGKIDINTATVPILISLSDKLSEEKIQDIIKVRDEKGGFKTKQEFLTLAEIKESNLPTERISLRSYFFLVDTHVQYKDATVDIHHIYQIKIKNDATIQLVSLSRVIAPA